ncbi:Tat pathway signal sequence domain protein [Actinophytocola sp.]|uniref:exo-rhamnogalacturonan lyase family protein n=1 Tax=Actinophytocola sp. TaxID=1872138 RepID=UPI002ED3BBC3
MSELSRRNLLMGTAFAGAFGLPRPKVITPPDHGEVGQARWLDGRAPAATPGVTWGMPWPRGRFPAGQDFTVSTVDGAPVPAQTWVTGYWPDGSVKWTAHAMGQQAATAASYRVAPGQPVAPATPVTVSTNRDTVDVDTGAIRVRLGRRGTALVRSIARGDREIARDGELVGLRTDSADDASARRESFTSVIRSVRVEQSGPVRAVVRVEGTHRVGRREWLPFVVRLYFYAGGDGVRMIHTFVFDGDHERDFIAGLGVRFHVPLTDEPYNRHVRLAGAGDGVLAEAVQGVTGLRRDPGAAVRTAQIAGQRTPDIGTWATTVSNRIQYIPTWGDHSLRQLSANGFQIRKRTKQGRGWVSVHDGGRASGLGYIGGPSGGFALGMKDFWQLHPTQVDIRGAAGEVAELTLWLWSPDATPMDLRSYHDGMGQDTFAKQLQGLEVTYEDYEPGYDTPQGIARTSELMFWALPGTPSVERFAELAAAVRTPPLLMAPPAHLHAAGVFGDWAPVDRSTPARARIEDRLDFLFEFHRGQVEQHGWYGFWDYGDVMHTYDNDRHVWRYDVGGFAWDNSELSTDIWLWYQFLRSGRSDVFRMAEAMTRHTGEVDVYHLGRFAGLGTRHGVRHWGDSAKQLRISTAANRRFYYFLTADERVGDLMRELIHTDRTFLAVDPIRKIRTEPYTPDPHALSIGFGTDWGALAAAWLTEWERGGDPLARQRLESTMRTIGAQTNGFVQGSALYDLDTGEFAVAAPPAVSVSHLSAVFGLVEMCSELVDLLDVPEFRREWLRYCRFYNATAAEQTAEFGASFGNLNLRQAHARLTAYAAARTADAALAARAWQEFHAGAAGYGPNVSWQTTRVEPPTVLTPRDETDFVSTNASAQYGLAAIQCLALVGDHLT